MKVYSEGNYVSWQTKHVQSQLCVWTMPVLGRKPKNRVCENFVKIQGDILWGFLNTIPVSTYEWLSTVTALEAPQCTYIIVIENFKIHMVYHTYKKR
jgi:hypothetical protein